MDGASLNFTDTDAFGIGTGTSEFPNSSNPVTPVTNKHVRLAASNDDIQSEASSDTKCARLGNVSFNSSDKKIAQFAVGYVNGGKPKAADYKNVMQALLLHAMHEYKSHIVYPDSAIQSKWAKICWREACHFTVEDYDMTEQGSKIVYILSPT